MRGAVSVSVTPVLLGSGSLSIKVAWSLFWRYFLVSNLFDRSVPLHLKLLTFISARKLSPSLDDRFTFMTLERFTAEYGDSTYLLIPCTEEFQSFTERNRDSLENKFIVRSPEQILAQRELFPLVSQHGKDC